MIHVGFGHVFLKLVVPCLALSAISLVPNLEVKSQDLESRFREEAPIGWKLLKKKHGQTKYKWEDSRRSDANEMKRTVSGSNAYRGDNFLVTVKSQDGTTVYGGNEIYNFSVQRRSEDHPWLLANLGQKEEVSFQAGDDEFSVMNRVPWTLYDIPCLELIANPSFVVKSIIEKPDGVVELEFSVDPIGVSQIRPGLTSGRIALLPDNDWAISSYEVELTRNDASSGPVTVAASVDYGPPQKDFINLRHVSYEVRWKSKGELRSSRWERDIISERCNEAKDSFRLAVFGVEEPKMFSGSSGLGAYLWPMLAVLFVGFIVLIIRWRTGQ